MNRIIRLSEAQMAQSAEVEITETPHEEPAPGLDPIHLRIVEALLFAASEPMDERALSRALPSHANVGALLSELQNQYEGRGVNLVHGPVLADFARPCRSFRDLKLCASGESCRLSAPPGNSAGLSP